MSIGGDKKETFEAKKNQHPPPPLQKIFKKREVAKRIGFPYFFLLKPSTATRIITTGEKKNWDEAKNQSIRSPAATPDHSMDCVGCNYDCKPPLYSTHKVCPGVGEPTKDLVCGRPLHSIDVTQ